MIIEKKVRDLKPGDILSAQQSGRQIVLVSRESIRIEAFGNYNVLLVDADVMPTQVGGLHEQTWVRWSPEAIVDVEAPDLTPAQQHADELAALLREAHDFIRAGSKEHRDSNAQFGVISGLKAKWRAWEPQVDALLKRIDPPQPPTLEEAIRVLVDVYAKSEDARSVTAISALLDRARSHGLL